MICSCLLQLPFTCLLVLVATFPSLSLSFPCCCFGCPPFSSQNFLVECFSKGFFLQSMTKDEKRLFAHTECIPIDRLRWYRATFLFYWSFAFIQWTSGVCVCCFCSLVTACPRRSDCHFKHFIGFWNSDCIHFPSFVNTNGGFECVQNSQIPSTGVARTVWRLHKKRF